jgi:hypothetical protein
MWEKMNKNVLLSLVAVLSFALGWACPTVYNCNSAGRIPDSRPLSLPYDRVNQSDIHVFQDRIVVEVGNVSWAEYGDSGSMIPVLGEGVNGFYADPESEADIRVGDIVAYEPDWCDDLVAHRVVGIGSDEEGTYYLVKGDNRKEADPGRVRFSQIKHVLIGVIY